MEVGIKVVAEDVQRRACRHAMTCYFTMVAVDENGRPTPVPELRPTDEVSRRRYEAAKRRRKLRAEVSERQAAIKTLKDE